MAVRCVSRQGILLVKIPIEVENHLVGQEEAEDVGILVELLEEVLLLVPQDEFLSNQ